MSRKVRAAAGVLLALLAIGPSAGHGSPPESAAAGPYAWVPVVEPADEVVPDPPDGRWLVDERGRQYTLFRWRKHQGYYQMEDGPGRTVRLRYGIRFTVEHEDGDYLYLRWYRTGPIRDRLAPPRAVTEAAPAADPARLPERDALRLEPWDEGLPRGGQWRNGFALADMNGDGHLDLVHGPTRKGPVTTPVIFLGDGAGRWRPWREARFPPLPYAYGTVAAGDLDGDGRMDLVLAAHLSGVFALRGDGAGGFVAWSSGLPVRARPVMAVPSGSPGRQRAAAPRFDTIEPSSFTSRAVALADWDGDGRLDVIALSEGPTSPRGLREGASAPLGKAIFLNRGDGSWEPRHGPGLMMGDTVLPVDLDGDGRIDFVTDSRVIGSAAILNHFEPGGAWRVASLPEARPRLRVIAVAVADFDGDGRRDLAVSYQSQEGGQVRRGLDLYLGTSGPAGWRRVPAWVAQPDETITALAAGDLDGDGWPDLAALTARGQVWILVNDGRGGFALDRSPEADPGSHHVHCAGYGVAIRDLDGDGRPEMVAAFAGEPGSEALLGPAEPVRCRAGGAIRAWKVRRGGE